MPQTTLEELTALPPDPLAGFKGPLRGKSGKEVMGKGRERDGEGGKNEGRREGRGFRF